MMADEATSIQAQQSKIQAQVDVMEGGEQVDLPRIALELNAKRQEVLKARLNALQGKLTKIDDTIKQIDSVDEAELPEAESIEQNTVVSIPGSFKSVGVLSRSRIIQPNSPFHEDAMRRQRYLDFTTTNSMNQKELQTIKKHVIMDNKRLWALEHPDEDFPISSDDSDFLQNRPELNWTRIAAGVSAEIGLDRSPRSCQIRWLSELHPGVNKQPWSDWEKANLRTLVDRYKGQAIDWNHIAQMLNTGRRPHDCIRQCLPSNSVSWTPEKELALKHAVARYGENNWQLVALAMKTPFNATQCQSHYQQITDTPANTTGAWTEEEDDLLRRSVAKFGTSNWSAVSRLVPGRNRNQCRDRWLVSPEPKSKSGVEWSEDEDEKLLDAVKMLTEEYDNISWRTVSMMLQRPEKECEQRYDELMGPTNPLALLERFKSHFDVSFPGITNRFASRDRRRHTLRITAPVNGSVRSRAKRQTHANQMQHQTDAPAESRTQPPPRSQPQPQSAVQYQGQLSTLVQQPHSQAQPQVQLHSQTQPKSRPKPRPKSRPGRRTKAFNSIEGDDITPTLSGSRQTSSIDGTAESVEKTVDFETEEATMNQSEVTTQEEHTSASGLRRSTRKRLP